MNVQRLSTNSPLDKILAGGIEYGVVTNIYGPAGCGKTNLALSTMLSVEDEKIIFIDTENNFSFERLGQLTKNEEILKKIIFFRPENWAEQVNIIKKLEDTIEKEKIKFIIVDSLVALYRLEINQENFSDINRQLATQYSLLSKIAREKNIPVLVTNQVYSTGSGKEDIEMTSKTIARYWSKALIELQKTDKPNHRVGIIRKHRSLPEGTKIEFRITKDGMEEPKFKLF